MNETLQQELIRDLLLESYEGLDRFDSELLKLEEGEGGSDVMNTIFRVIHTLKGTAGCLGLGQIEKTAHAGENLLSLLRDGKLVITPVMITSLLALSDALRGMLRSLEATGGDGTADHSELLATLEKLQTSPAPVAASAPPVEPNAAFGLFTDDDLPPVQTDVAVIPAPVLVAKPPSLPAPSIPSSKPASLTESAALSTAADPTGRSSVAENAIRVDIAQLDKVMNLVGELVLARNQIIANTTQFDQSALLTASQRLNIITTELQESVMKTRMQPIGNVWAKFPRIVRDVSQDLGKRVRLIMEGQSTELDRTIIESIKDPLTHIVRNSIDHGIEGPEKRRAAGKAEEGLLSLRAYHEGGQVNIEIMDDGGGINIERVKAKAVAQNLITAERAAALSERESLNLIFLPGLSTAEKITNVSGRGVGMDVVKTNIEKIGGSIDLQTQAGQGTTLKIKIPLTLAIIPALIVTSGGDRYAIPQVSLLELVRLEGAQARKGIEHLYGASVYRLRGQLLPLAYLNRQFKVAPGVAKQGAAEQDEVINIIVLQADGRPFGLVVDEINDTEEIVVKPLGKQLKGITSFAGATIMGDGRVALILDVVGLAQHANVVAENRDRNVATLKTQTDTANEDRQTLLVFSVGADRRMAIPLALAARLEEIPTSRLERTGGLDVVQYRGQILPLIRVADHVAGRMAPEAPSDLLQVVVYAHEGRSYGLVVSRIIDIVDEAISIRRSAPSRGILGSIVVQEKVTDLLDVPGVIAAAEALSAQSAA